MTFNYRYHIAVVSLAAFLVSGNALAAADDDPLLYFWQFNKLEWHDAGDHEYAWKTTGWLGRDLHKLWIKTEGKREAGELEKVELQFLYSRPISPYWDLQTGFHHDIEPAFGRNWFAIGVNGVAPYFVHVDAALFVGEAGRTAFRFDAEYELMLTQRLILVPEIESNFYGRDDRANRLGAGLSDIEVGLRLRYEIRRELAPYIGVTWERRFGSSADFARADGKPVSDSHFVAGLTFWF